MSTEVSKEKDGRGSSRSGIGRWLLGAEKTKGSDGGAALRQFAP